MRLGVSGAVVGGAWCPGDVTVDDGTVTAVGLPPARGDVIAVPGLVDLLCHGYAGVDLASAAVEEVATLRTALARDGTTALCPSLLTDDPDRTVAALGRLDEARAHPDSAGHEPGSHLLGAHLEGPFLAPTRLGTHPPEHRRDPDPTLLARLLDAGRVDLVTLAPELPGAGALVDLLHARGIVVSAGHSDAGAAAAQAAVDRGVTVVTHVFNAMSGLDHRAPGLAAVALTRSEVVVTVIGDGHHVAPEMLRLVAAAAPGRWALVTDATAAAGMPDGPHRLAGVPVTLADGVVRNTSGGLAGAAGPLVRGVRTAVAAGVGLVEAVGAATSVPARVLGRPDLGRLVPGAAADVVLLDAGLAVSRVVVGGRTVGVE
ncbi:N-acetylglucosamine-6-phosphate deacetylase [Actinomycetospora cinnamomea]|uniref:N-acetylglucosamine 6-phosphate deacetylase n=1 Tax=Actinomycetospora cinnamomea TaxID=663609 RepID=A0A2U1EBM7_9PSEU|nr:amidohydrolase family protein [Actinomycetospora cinnamomea]PVY97285.1 N-acetylglucosamine 6-phosphate deacetylase [Actinomycetospora cinnamomea]